MIRFDRSRMRSGTERSFVLDLLERGLRVIDPARSVTDAIDYAAGRLQIGTHICDVSGRRIWIVAIGKAAAPMAEAVTNLLGAAIAGGIVLTRYGYGGDIRMLRVLEAGHPIPDRNGSKAAMQIAMLADRVAPDDFVFCLVSGGGSALLASPPPGVSVNDLAALNRLLLESGAAIDQINTVRRHVSTLQGGQLARRLHPARVITLVLSDVVDDRLEAIASGPTVADPTGFDDAIDVLQRYRIWERSPRPVRTHLMRGVAGETADTVKPADPAFHGSVVRIVGNNAALLDALDDEARAAGCRVVRAAEPVTGEASDIGREMAQRGLDLAGTRTGRTLFVSGGETTVTVRGTGRGGRNQELALAAALALEGTEGICVAALATDGSDGVTEAAGAMVDGGSAVTARREGIDPAAALRNNDSNRALEASGDLLHTGATRTNVADAYIMLVGPSGTDR